MELINEDLRELELGTTDLGDIFWAVNSEHALAGLTERIRQQYRRMLNTMDEEQMRAVRAFVSSTVVLGAVRGVRFGYALYASRRSKKRANDPNVDIVLSRKSISNLLRQTKPTILPDNIPALLREKKRRKLSANEIVCLELDQQEVRFPWEELIDRKKEGTRLLWPWFSNAKHPTVKRTLTRARTKLRKVDGEIQYVRTFMRNWNGDA